MPPAATGKIDKQRLREEFGHSQARTIGAAGW
jgi:hypothetical protein